MGGVIVVRVDSADCIAVLDKIRKIGVITNRIHFIDEFTVEFQIQGKSLKKVIALVEKRNEKIEVLDCKGTYWTLLSWFKRPVLVFGITVVLFLTIYLPTRVFFFRVEGNTAVPTQKIIEAAMQCGIDFGAARTEIRSEKVKNALLQALPELEWAGINTSGCVATISVRERQEIDTPSEGKGVTSIVAVRDGVIQQIEIVGGNPKCKVGQAVKAGQVLISGYTDCGLTIRGERAKGEVYATTNRHFTVMMPSNWIYRGDKITSNRKFSMKIGKKQINFYQDSGISDSRCVKMYEQRYLTLPGGFILPISFVVEVCEYYSEDTLTSTDQLAPTDLSLWTDQYLQCQAVACRILSKQETFQQADGVHILDTDYYCLEMIGREQNEEILAP